MMTKLLNPKTDPGAIETAAELLKSGAVVGLPTETVYGLGANALDGQAVKKIFEAKGRPQDNPLIVHIAELDSIHRLVSHIPDSAYALFDAFWPGPLTIILPKSKLIPDEVSAGLDTVGIRFPSHPIARQIIKACNLPIAAPSANLSGRPSTTTAQHVLEDLDGKIAAVVDGGPCGVGLESTVISLAGERPRLLRPGGITLEALESVLGSVDVDHAVREKISDSERVSAPGMKYRHYAPKAPLTAVCGAPDATAKFIQKELTTGTAVLCYDEYRDFFAGYPVVSFGPSGDLGEQARRVFDALRQFDLTDAEKILAQCPNDDGIGLAVANRIKKAAGFNVITV